MSINTTALGAKFAQEINNLSTVPLKKLVIELNKQGYTQRQIAKWAGVDTAMVNRWIKKGQDEKK